MIKNLFEEYWKQLFLIVVAPTFGWWAGLFKMLSIHLYQQVYELPRWIVWILVFSSMLLIAIFYRKYSELLKFNSKLKEQIDRENLGVDLERILLGFYNLQEGYLLAENDLVTDGYADNIQIAKYYIEELSTRNLIETNYHIEETGELQYELSANGRAYIFSREMHKKA